MALIDRVVEKLSPSRRHRRASIQHEQREFGGAATSFSDLIMPKEGRHFLPTLFVADCRNKIGAQELHHCPEVCSKAA
ncbi:hypothetical protein [Bradyrhizobium vignae]|uniref:hypothetical protein n=1 Tax=Bradyrhizobium TaxID=374 RepID=UPI00100A4850|nr:hypothetical protein [Bradyrhizobium vignae]RXG95111.1 hypothetical protein EAV90_24695 [Bradyrhizobium vignae]